MSDKFLIRRIDDAIAAYTELRDSLVTERNQLIREALGVCAADYFLSSSASISAALSASEESA